VSANQRVGGDLANLRISSCLRACVLLIGVLRVCVLLIGVLRVGVLRVGGLRSGVLWSDYLEIAFINGCLFQ